MHSSPRFHWKDKLEELFGADLRSLAALRVALAALIIVDLVRRSRDLSAHYTDFGILPRVALLESGMSRWRFSLHLANGTWEFQALLFCLAGMFAVALLIGYRTRIATVMSWLMLASLHSRNPLILDGGDFLIRLLLFWAIFLPWGTCWSVDQALRDDYEATSGPAISAATVAYAAQIVFMYWFSVFLKSKPDWLHNASALYYTLHFEQFLTPWAQYIRSYALSLSWLTRGVFWFELVGPLLLFSPFWTSRLRIIAIIALVLLHLGIGIFMNVGIFTWIAPLCMLGLLPAEVWNRLAARLSTKDRLGLRIYYDRECLFCFRTVRLLKTFFLIPETIMKPAQADPSLENDMRSRDSWVVVDETGNRYYQFEAVVVVVSRSPLLWPFAKVLGWRPISKAGARIYAMVAKQRQRFGCSISRTPSSLEPPRVKLGITLNLLVSLLLAYVLIWNVSTLPNSPIKLSDRARALGEFLRVDQIWNMFATTPKYNTWYVVAGTLKSGEVVDILRDGDSVNWQHPPSVPDLFPSYRWWKYFFTLSNVTEEKFWRSYVSYECRTWNAHHAMSETLEGLHVVNLAEQILSNEERGPIQRYIVFADKCAEKS